MGSSGSLKNIVMRIMESKQDEEEREHGKRSYEVTLGLNEFRKFLQWAY